MLQPDTSVIEDRDKGSSPSGPIRRPNPVLGLIVVSALNVVCLVFVINHFINHPDEAVTSVAEDKVENTGTTGVMPLATLSPNVIMGDAAGNVDLLPTSRQVISIASGIHMSDVNAVDSFRNVEIIPAEATRAVPAVPTRSGAGHGHWVQLGALSKAATATEYWSALKVRHATLLQDRAPSYVGPDDVGGGLYHIRVGPMDAHGAEDLCKKLQAAGADCFCVSPVEREQSREG